jgi:hypothetical protein
LYPEVCCAGQRPKLSVVASQDRCSQCFVAGLDTGTHTAGANAAEQHVCCLHMPTASVPGMQVETAPLATTHVISEAHQLQQGCCPAGEEDPSESTPDTACILSTRLSTTSRLFVMLSCLLEQMANTLAVPVWYQAAGSPHRVHAYRCSTDLHTLLKRQLYTRRAAVSLVITAAGGTKSGAVPHGADGVSIDIHAEPITVLRSSESDGSWEPQHPWSRRNMLRFMLHAGTVLLSKQQQEDRSGAKPRALVLHVGGDTLHALAQLLQGVSSYRPMALDLLWQVCQPSMVQPAGIAVALRLAAWAYHLARRRQTLHDAVFLMQILERGQQISESFGGKSKWRLIRMIVCDMENQAQ